MEDKVSNGKAGRDTPPENDKVMTPVGLAQQCIDIVSPHFQHGQKFLEPCRGTGVFYNLLPHNKDWCEIDEGRDFLEYNERVDWIITNPPFSVYEEFLAHSLELADNVVFLVPLSKIWSSLRRVKMIDDYGGIRHLHTFTNGARKFGFPFGFPMCLLWVKRDYKNAPVFSGALKQGATNKKTIDIERQDDYAYVSQ